MNNWGATDNEVEKTLPGDDLISEPAFQATRAITIDAPPEDVWPWLVQLGDRRGGLYSYDWLDILFGYLEGPSATEIIPEFQHVEEGDHISLRKGGDLIVKQIEPERALVTIPELLPEGALIWSFILEPAGEGRTRLLTRNRGSIDGSLRWRVMMLLIEPAAFLMTRKMLLGIKERAEERAGTKVVVIS